MKIAKWGNSLAVRIPRDVADALDLEAGDEVTLRAGADDSLEIVREPTLAEILDSIRRRAKPLPEDYKFDREEANAR